MGDRLLSRKQVTAETSLSRSTIYREIAAGRFPRPDRLTGGRVAWPESRLQEWKAKRPMNDASP